VALEGPTNCVVSRDGAVIVSGDAAALLYRATLALILREHRDGLAPSPLLHQLRRELYRATTMSPPRHQDDSRPPTKSCCSCQDGDDLIGTAEAATLLSLSPRQVARLAAQNVGLGGIRLRHAWVLRRAPVLALAQRRKAAT
jgi:hypothetical protein